MSLFKEETEFKTISGRGLKGIIDGKEVFVGNRQLLESNGVVVSQTVADIDELTILCMQIYDFSAV